MEKLETHESIISYIKQRVNPIIEPLQFDVLLYRPDNVVDFSYKWLKNYQKEIVKNQSLQQKFENQSDDDLDDLNIADELPDEIFLEKIKNRGRRKTRKGISGEVYSTIGNEGFKKIHGEKVEEERIKILINLRTVILFKNLSEKNITQIINCMQKKFYKAGDVVINQGEIGNELFLVDSGIFKCEVEGKEQFEKVYEGGQIFGELALLYGTKRASTITALTDGKLFSLSRQNFNIILRDQVLKKTKLCEETLFKNQVFSSMSHYQRSKISQNLKQLSLPAGKYVIREGQIGDRFYIVCEGNLVAEKQVANGDIKSVYYYKKGDYFGQISLIRNIPRQASVKTLTTSKLLFIERSAFKRLLGPSQSFLKMREQKYQELNSLKQMEKENEGYCL